MNCALAYLSQPTILGFVVFGLVVSVALAGVGVPVIPPRRGGGA